MIKYFLAPPLYVEFHPSGGAIGTGNADGSVKIYELRTGSLHQYYAAHIDAVNKISFHPNGNFMLTASEDSTMKVILSHTSLKIFNSKY